ncbi:hypothetical protein KAR91_27880 [Candidatus Pacearchaeota archaeon]|nr:hypothetical protein [Candidatus Pacearchaeota archaeon]
MKRVLIICILLMFGCSGPQLRVDYYPAGDILAHPTNPDMSCLHPEFFMEGMEEFEDCIGGKVPFEGSRTLEAHPSLKGYQCITDEFLIEIISELELCVDR